MISVANDTRIYSLNAAVGFKMTLNAEDWIIIYTFLFWISYYWAQYSPVHYISVLLSTMIRKLILWKFGVKLICGVILIQLMN